jgi:hypothetical protein
VQTRDVVNLHVGLRIALDPQILVVVEGIDEIIDLLLFSLVAVGCLLVGSLRFGGCPQLEEVLEDGHHLYVQILVKLPQRMP